MVSLPTPGADAGVWGQELNNWLLADHDVDGTHSFAAFTAADHGYLAWSGDPALVSSTSTLTSGTVAVSRINARYSISVFNVVIGTGSNGVGLTTGQNLAALFNSAGTRIGVTADQTTPWATAGLQTMALTGGPFTLPAGFYWACLLSVAATTPISVARGGNGLTATVNAGLLASTARAATVSTGQTAMPSSFIPSSLTLNNVPFWCALS